MPRVDIHIGRISGAFGWFDKIVLMLAKVLGWNIPPSSVLVEVILIHA